MNNVLQIINKILTHDGDDNEKKVELSNLLGSLIDTMTGANILYILNGLDKLDKLDELIKSNESLELLLENLNTSVISVMKDTSAKINQINNIVSQPGGWNNPIHSEKEPTLNKLNYLKGLGELVTDAIALCKQKKMKKLDESVKIAMLGQFGNLGVSVDSDILDNLLKTTMSNPLRKNKLFTLLSFEVLDTIFEKLLLTLPDGVMLDTNSLYTDKGKDEINKLCLSLDGTALENIFENIRLHKSIIIDLLPNATLDTITSKLASKQDSKSKRIITFISEKRKQLYTNTINRIRS